MGCGGVCGRGRPSPLQLPHCPHHAGVGRSGTFVALLRLLQQLEEERVVDVLNTVYTLRLHRPLMIQTPVRAQQAGTPRRWVGGGRPGDHRSEGSRGGSSQRTRGGGAAIWHHLPGFCVPFVEEDVGGGGPAGCPLPPSGMHGAAPRGSSSLPPSPAHPCLAGWAWRLLWRQTPPPPKSQYILLHSCLLNKIPEGPSDPSE